MKIILCISTLLFLLTLSGCNFLQGSGYDNYESDEMAVEEEEGWIEEDEESWDEDDEAEDEEDDWDEDEDEEDDWDEDEDEEDDWDEDEDEEDDWDEDEDEEENEGEEKKGFFTLLFGGKKDKKSDDDVMSDGDDYEDSNPISETDPKQAVPFSNEEAASSNEEAVSSSEEAASSNVQSQSKPTKSPTRQPLNKILKYPYNKAGFLVNAIYIARSNENLQSISQKIYQQDKTSELTAINSHLKNRSVTVGDKIYYNSPNRPNDNKRILLYYEDNDISSSYYTLSKGENIREAAYKLLGHANSWKEIWATNPELQSKSEVQDNITITYWEAGASAPALAPSEPEPVLPSEPDLNKLPNFDEEIEDNLEKDRQDENKAEEKQAFTSDFAPEKDKEQEDDSDREKSGIIAKFLENVEIAGIFIVFVFIVGLVLRLVIKKRKQREFDYTSV